MPKITGADQLGGARLIEEEEQSQPPVEPQGLFGAPMLFSPELTMVPEMPQGLVAQMGPPPITGEPVEQESNFSVDPEVMKKLWQPFKYPGLGG
jgi:hypothetical protein